MQMKRKIKSEENEETGRCRWDSSSVQTQDAAQSSSKPLNRPPSHHHIEVWTKDARQMQETAAVVRRKGMGS